VEEASVVLDPAAICDDDLSDIRMGRVQEDARKSQPRSENASPLRSWAKEVRKKDMFGLAQLAGAEAHGLFDGLFGTSKLVP
jgi:hypothetical protein